MSVEYILFGIDEMTEIKKGLLTAQLAALNSQQYLHNYKKLRSEEMNQKVKLKSLLDQVQNELQVLKALMPETSQITSKTKQPLSAIHELSSTYIQREEKQKSSLESEIESIRQKLQRLQ